MTDTSTHRFELAGLGVAPFRVAGFEIRTYQACHGAPVQVGGSCDYCGTGIKNTYLIDSSDGRRFVVGSSCVRKTGDAGLKRAAKKAADPVLARASYERDALRIADATSSLRRIDVRRALRAVPHGQKWRRDLGETGLNEAIWMLRNAGQAGKLRTARRIERVAS